MLEGNVGASSIAATKNSPSMLGKEGEFQPESVLIAMLKYTRRLRTNIRHATSSYWQLAISVGGHQCGLLPISLHGGW